jgi:hypothetical protein
MLEVCVQADDSRPHGPLWLERRSHLGLGEDGVTGETADSTSAATESLLLNGRDATAVATDRSRVAAVVRLAEFPRRRKVECSKRV